MAPKLHHIALTISNTDETLQWYSKVFNLSLEKTVRRDDLGVSVYFLANDVLRLELFSFVTASPLPDYRKNVDDDIRVCGTKHFAIEVDDLGEAIAQAVAWGSTHVEGPQISFDGGNRFAFVSDPSGTLVELIQFPRGTGS